MAPDAASLLRLALPISLGYAYLDAKHALSVDFKLIRGFIMSRFHIRMKEFRQRLNPFYLLENMAISKNAVDRDQLFLIYQGKEWTYAQAYDMTLRHATWLQDRWGVKERDVVALDMMNRPAFLWIWFGLWALGAAPAFINYNLTGEGLLHCVNAAKSDLLILDPEVLPNVGEELMEKMKADGKRVVLFDEHTETLVRTWRSIRPPDSCRENAQAHDIAILIFTSGTTGFPKPAVVSLHKIHFVSGFCLRFLNLQRTDRLYTAMPLYHSTAALAGVGNVLTSSSTLALGHKFSASGNMKEIRESKATIMQYVGEICRYMLASPPQPGEKEHNLRMAFGNGLRGDIWRPFKERFNIPAITEFYASTEGSLASFNYQTGNFGEGAIGRNGTISAMYIGRGVKIVKLDYETEAPFRDPNTGLCVEADVDEPGELLWRLDPNDTARNFQGYYGNKKATEEKMLRDVFKKGDVWFRTGDLQRRDEAGLWYFSDRIGDTFRWKSENVSTAEVQEVICKHPAIEEACVYGVEVPGHEGRAGAAAICLRKDAELNDALMVDLANWVSEKLPKYARPVFLRVVQKLETTGNHKHVKHGYRKAGADPKNLKEGEELYWLKPQEKGYAKLLHRDWDGLVGGKTML